MGKYSQKIKIQRQGSAVITIPKVMLQLMKLTYGDIVNVEFDTETNEMTVSNPNIDKDSKEN